MKIVQVRAFQYDIAYAGGDYVMSRGRVSRSQTSLVLQVRTDDGVDGWAETCPNGRTYLPSFVEGERAALGVLAPTLIGLDPRNLASVWAAMRQTLLGSNAAKATVDMACFDILGQAAGLSVTELLGGRTQGSFPLFTAAPIAPPEATARYVGQEKAAGVRVFQVKVGDAPDRDVARVEAALSAAGPGCVVVADANGGWDLQSALLATRRLDGLPVRLEQPCRTLSECAELRRHTQLPLILDESVVTVEDLVRANDLVGASGVNLKPGRLGGYTGVRVLRDLAQGLGMTFTVDDTWGGAIATAQNAHLAASSDPAHLTAATSFAGWTSPQVAGATPPAPPGRGRAPARPGLGVQVDAAAFGPPVLDVTARG